jgi:hypothetical protein
MRDSTACPHSDSGAAKCVVQADDANSIRVDLATAFVWQGDQVKLLWYRATCVSGGGLAALCI